MGLFDFLFPSVDAIFPVTLLIKAILIIAFIVLAIIIIKFLPKGKFVGLFLCFIAIVGVWLYI